MMTGVGVVEVAVIGLEEEIGRDGITLIGRLGKTHLRRAKKYPNQVPVRITVNHRPSNTEVKDRSLFRWGSSASSQGGNGINAEIAHSIYIVILSARFFGTNPRLACIKEDKLNDGK
jgi:hypothetical protein